MGVESIGGVEDAGSLLKAETDADLASVSCPFASVSVLGDATRSPRRLPPLTFAPHTLSVDSFVILPPILTPEVHRRLRLRASLARRPLAQQCSM